MSKRLSKEDIRNSTGVLNPLDSVAAVCRRHAKGLFIDAVASFGAIDIYLFSFGINQSTVIHPSLHA